MPPITPEQIEQARSVDLLTYLQTHEPHSIRKSGANEYCLVEHDSLKISNGRWNWFFRGFGGHSTLNFLIKVRGLDFPQAVKQLTGGEVTYSSPKPPLSKIDRDKSPKPFSLPAKNINNDKVIAYLRGRGIDNDIIRRCIENGLLYEAAKSHNCVFVGYGSDNPKFACEHGITDTYKKDVYGSDKRLSFFLPPINPNSTNLMVTESPIDCLSHASIYKLGGDKWDCFRLSLGGVSSLALINFLERYPEITSIQLCLDNDKAGQNAKDRIIGELLSKKQFSHIRLSVVPPPIGKDCSDTLTAILQLNKDKSIKNRHDKAVFAI